MLNTILKFLGVESAKFAIGDLFPAIMVSGFAWLVFSMVLILPIRFFVNSDDITPDWVNKAETVLVGVAFFISFGGGLYLWASGF